MYIYVHIHIHAYICTCMDKHNVGVVQVYGERMKEKHRKSLETRKSIDTSFDSEGPVAFADVVKGTPPLTLFFLFFITLEPRVE